MRKLLPRRSVRLRLTALYTVLFLLSGVVLLAITSGVVVASSAVTAYAPPQPNPQSALAITFSRPTSLAKRMRRSAISSGCSTMLLAWVMTPGQRTLPSGSFTVSNT